MTDDLILVRVLCSPDSQNPINLKINLFVKKCKAIMQQPQKTSKSKRKKKTKNKKNTKKRTTEKNKNSIRFKISKVLLQLL